MYEKGRCKITINQAYIVIWQQRCLIYSYCISHYFNESVETKCDSNLHQIISIHPSMRVQKERHFGLPKELLKSAQIQAFINND